ncbi:hypothetical protein EIP86_003498 [Pleurotus ostreatoroseus]|nr:hypothetical protein EIP86_003498 [Pleurotus ostreatoroseus]
MDSEAGLPQGKEPPSPQDPTPKKSQNNPTQATPSTFKLIIAILGLYVPSYKPFLDQPYVLAVLPIALYSFFAADNDMWRCVILILAFAAYALERILASRRAAVSEAYLKREGSISRSYTEDGPLWTEANRYPNGALKNAVWWYYLWYMDTETGESRGRRRRMGLDNLRARSFERMVAQYLERERTRDSQATFRERLASKWDNLWSSIGTRAAIDDVIQEYCNELPSDASRIPERDRRHFVSYTANMLEYRHLERSTRLISSALLYGTLTYAFFLSVFTASNTTVSWIINLCWGHSTLALTFAGLTSAIWHFTNIYRWTELLRAPLQHTDPQEAAMLHAWWYDWTPGGGRRLREAKIWNAAVAVCETDAEAAEWKTIVQLTAVDVFGGGV